MKIDLTKIFHFISANLPSDLGFHELFDIQFKAEVLISNSSKLLCRKDSSKE